MAQFYVVGLFANKQALKKKGKTGTFPPGTIEPFARTIWANSPREALQIATEELKGGEWTEGPKVARTSEGQQMRSMGAPEFPGFSQAPPTKKKYRK